MQVEKSQCKRQCCWVWNMLMKIVIIYMCWELFWENLEFLVWINSLPVKKWVSVSDCMLFPYDAILYETNEKLLWPLWALNLLHSWPTFIKKKKKEKETGTSTHSMQTRTKENWLIVNKHRAAADRTRLSELRLLVQRTSLCGAQLEKSPLTSATRALGTFCLAFPKLQLHLIDGNIPKLNLHKTISLVQGQPILTWLGECFRVTGITWWIKYGRGLATYCIALWFGNSWHSHRKLSVRTGGGIHRGNTHIKIHVTWWRECLQKVDLS